MANDEELSQELPSEVEDLLSKASKEILDKQEGYCFTIDNPEPDNDKELYSAAYDPSELAEFINFDVLGEEGENIEPFHKLVNRDNCQDLTSDKKVRKILLDPGEYNGTYYCIYSYLNQKYTCLYMYLLHILYLNQMLAIDICFIFALL